MLHDPKWGFGTLAHLRGWLASKPRNEVYDWSSCTACCAAQYFTAHGQSVPSVTKFYEPFGSTSLYSHVCSNEPRTFGGASDRLEARIADHPLLMEPVAA
jgi:hypothetical protein